MIVYSLLGRGDREILIYISLLGSLNFLGSGISTFNAKAE